MDTVSFVFSSTPIKVSINGLKDFSIDLELSGIDMSPDIYSKGNKKLIGKTKLESSLENELDEPVFSRKKNFNFEKSASWIETKHNEIKSHDNDTLEVYKNCLEEKWKNLWD